MKNNIYMLLAALILVALPACGGSKKAKNVKANEVTINNNVDTISIQEINEVSENLEDTSSLNISKF